VWIIVEGPTCSGKSTIYDAINKRLTREGTQLETVHMERPQKLNRRWALNEYVNRWEAKPDYDSSILADRWHFGEMTYAPIYRPDTNKDGYGLLGRAGWRWTELFLKSRGAVVAHITARPEVLVERLHSRGDDHVQNDDELLKVANLYDRSIVESPSTSIIVNTDRGVPPEQHAESIIQLADAHVAYYRELSAFPEYIGPRAPAVLLVGDKRNITKRYGEETILPFMPVDGNSGEYLLNALPQMWWHLCGLVNGMECSDLRKLWNVLGRPRVSALGNQAALACKQANVPRLDWNHPQYMRRFKNGEQKEYGELITAGGRL